MRKFVTAVLVALALVGTADGSGDSFGFTAALKGVSKTQGVFSATLTGTSLAWKLSFTSKAGSAELAGPIAVRLCGPCKAPAKGTVALTAAQASLLKQGKALARLHTAKGLLSGKVRLVITKTGPGTSTGTTTPAGGTGPAGTTWTATAVALRGQYGNRFEFVCPPNAYQNAGPVWGGGTEYFTDTSSVCAASVMTGDINLQGGGLTVIEMVPGQLSYNGATMNGITSQSFGPAPGSFIVIHDS